MKVKYVQIDFIGLSESEMDQIADLVIQAGYDLNDYDNYNKPNNINRFFQLKDGMFGLHLYSFTKQTITPIAFKKLIKKL